MTTQRLNCLVLAAILLPSIAACSREAKPSSGATITLSQAGSSLVANVDYNGSESLLMDGKFALSGLAGDGNVQIIPVDRDGIRYSVCSYIDSSIAGFDPVILRNGNKIKVELGNIETIGKLYCLPSGEYFMTILYFDGRGNQLLSNVIKVKIRRKSKN